MTIIIAITQKLNLRFSFDAQHDANQCFNKEDHYISIRIYKVVPLARYNTLLYFRYTYMLFITHTHRSYFYGKNTLYFSRNTLYLLCCGYYITRRPIVINMDVIR